MAKYLCKPKISFNFKEKKILKKKITLKQCVIVFCKSNCRLKWDEYFWKALQKHMRNNCWCLTNTEIDVAFTTTEDEMRNRGNTICCYRRSTTAWKHVKNRSRSSTTHNVAFYISETKVKLSPGAEMMNLTAWRWPWKHSWAKAKVQYGMEDSEPVGAKK